MYTLIAFATQWGSRHGGINSFNADFLSKFGAAFHHGTQIVCVVTDHSPKAAEEAANSHVRLIALPYIPKERSFDSSIGELSVDLLKKADIAFEPEKTIWLGHDLITGAAAITAANVAGGHSAVIHHMSYDDYESYAEDSESAQKKTEKQTAILRAADLVLAIGPLLRDAAIDRLGTSKPVPMLVPGLPEIDSKETPKKFVAFLSGRLTADAARIKQGHLGVAAFAAAELHARKEGLPEALKRQPKLLLRGVDFENRVSNAELNATHDPETELKQFAEEYAKGVVNLHALPYTEDRQKLYSELSAASVALMPSWHEGFGLVAWEAIAAGVPLIIGENTGVYRLLDEEYSGAQTGYVYALDVSGKSDFPYFRPEDLEITINALKLAATDPGKARNRAGQLRNRLLEKFSWAYCCENAAEAFSWDLQIGSVPDRTSEIIQEIAEQASDTTVSIPVEVGPLKIPRGQWRPAAGMADSQLLRAEEELLPFDTRRQPQVDELRAWASHPSWPITVRLITGDGGQGKTRLAIYLCQKLRSEGWHSGFLDSSLESDRMPLLWHELTKLDQPILIVVDYAETRQEAFLSLLQSALQNAPPKAVRMMLLARNGGEWWDNLSSTNSRCEGLLSGPATTGPFALPPLYAAQQDRQEAFSYALTAFSKVLHVDNPGIVPELEGDQFQRPLFVQMAALLALYGERPTTIQGLTKALLNHERRYWVALFSAFNWPDPGLRAEQLLALATLAGGFPTAKSAETFWSAVRGTDVTAVEFSLLFRNLAALYPGAQGLQPLRPDLLGEALVAQAILRPEGDVLLDSVLSKSPTQQVRRHALTVIARMANERADVHEILINVLSRRLENCAAELVAVSTETASRLPDFAEIAFGQLSSGVKNQVGGLLKQSLPRRSVQLSGLSCIVFGYLAERARQRLEQKPNSAERLYDCAEALDKYGGSLFYNRQYEEARNVGKVALDLMSKLVSRERTRYEATYATYLFNYAANLDKLGEDEEALIYDDKALQIRKQLARKNPNQFEPAYARSLNHYANRLRLLGRIQEALEKGEQAVQIYRKLRKTESRNYEHDYAEALNNYAVHLSYAGQLEESRSHSREALEIRGRLREKNRDRFEPDYATSLSNHAIALAEVGRLTEGLEFAKQAYTATSRLAHRRPQLFGIDFFDIYCLVRILGWLCDQESSGYAAPTEEILSSIPQREYVRMRITAAVVDAFLATDRETRAREFRFVLSNWAALSRRQQQRLDTFKFCAAAWCAKFDLLIETEWQDDWRKYLVNHKGNIPFWLSEVARRLQVEFPNTYAADG